MKKATFSLPVLLIVVFTLVCFAVMCDQIGYRVLLAPQESDLNTQIANPININTATTQEFMLLPGIGENLANRIVAYRQEHGIFTTIGELSNVPGIGQETLREISKYITVGE